MKRFYREVTVAPVADEDGDAFQILLDGRRVKSPVGRDLALPSRALTNAVAAEWEAQTEKILPGTMPLTQLAFTAIDRIAPERADVAIRIARYGETDLLCYRADAPRDLVLRQAEAWDPLLAWAADEFGAVLTVTDGIVPVAQPEPAMEALAAAVGRLDAFRLTALAAVVQAAGSLVIGLALAHGRLDAATAVAVSQLDESYQSEKWGADKEALDRLRALQAEITQAEAFLGLL
ncbi:MAG: ATPase [Rhodospirillales bacterium CG15_BIG_FIL_POST_REV_8_21_14_020_66_15]|nr:MAG: ATPase [Rhodospirillales bacterium CG15_BIG_FIL_POST_REV_8_21_14_020_66_15]